MVAKAEPEKLDEELRLAVQQENEHEEDCKMALMEGRPCSPSFLEQISCSKWEQLRNCPSEDCQRALRLCRPETEPATIMGENYGTIQPEIIPPHEHCTPTKRFNRCCRTPWTWCCSGSCVKAAIDDT